MWPRAAVRLRQLTNGRRRTPNEEQCHRLCRHHPRHRQYMSLEFPRIYKANGNSRSPLLLDLIIITDIKTSLLLTNGVLRHKIEEPNPLTIALDRHGMTEFAQSIPFLVVQHLLAQIFLTLITLANQTPSRPQTKADVICGMWTLYGGQPLLSWDKAMRKPTFRTFLYARQLNCQHGKKKVCWKSTPVERKYVAGVKRSKIQDIIGKRLRTFKFPRTFLAFPKLWATGQPQR